MTTNTRRKLLEKIDQRRDQAIDFLQKMIAIPSVTGDEAKIQTFLADYLAGIGLDVDKWETDWEELKKHPAYRPVARGYEGRPNIVATLKGTGGGRSLLLNGHTDVIPVGGGEGWSDDPWSATIRDGRVVGRGERAALGEKEEGRGKPNHGVGLSARGGGEAQRRRLARHCGR